MSLDSIITVTISTATTQPTRVGFGTPLVMGFHTVFAERARVYTAVADMITDGFATTDPEVAAVTALFAQNPRPVQAIVGRRANGVSMDIKLTPIPQNSTTYTVTINGTAFTFVSDVSATAAEISLGLTTAINLGSEPVTATDNVGTFDLTADVVGDLFTLEVDRALLTQDDETIDAGIVADYLAIQIENDDFYAVLPTSHATLEIEALAVTIEAQKKILLSATADDDVLTGSSSDLMSTLQTASRKRTITMYHPKPHQYPAAAWAGQLLPLDPGSATWKFKTLAGIDTTILTATEQTNALGKDGNIYVAVAGIPITCDGKGANGEFIDITRGVDWYSQRLQERIFAQLANLPKVPFTNQGIAVVENEIHGQNQDAIDVGLFAADPAPTVSAPDAGDVSAANKTARLLPDVTFSATLAGAIHAVQINGTVSV